MEQLAQGLFGKAGANHADAAGVIRRAGTHVALTGYIVEMQPALRPGHNALGAQHRAVFAGIQRGKGVVQLGLGVHARRFAAKALKYLVCMVVALVAVVVPAAAGVAVLVMFMFMPVPVGMLFFVPVPAGLAGAALFVVVFVGVLDVVLGFAVKACFKGSLRVSEAEEAQGLDVAAHGESAYPAYVGLD